jgi:heme-degrading monooxygenase HmoA
MSVVKINAIEVPAGAGPELEARFAARARSVENQPGFEEFQLLRPTEGETRYFVYTRWDSEESFQAWMTSQAFQHGHTGAPSASHTGGPSASHTGGPSASHTGGPSASQAQAAARPVSTGASLLAFDVIQHVVGGGAGGASSSF